MRGILSVLSLLVAGPIWAGPDLTLDQVDPVVGEYVGQLTVGEKSVPAEAKIYAVMVQGNYRAVVTAGQERMEFQAGFIEGAKCEVYPTRQAAEAAKDQGVNYATYEGNWDKLPDFDALKPIKTGKAPYFDVSVRPREDHFGLKFTGFIKINEAGRYILSTTSDDGSRLLIGDKVVVDNDGLHPEQRGIGEIELTQGIHPITVTYFDGEGGKALDVVFGRSSQTDAGAIQFIDMNPSGSWKGSWQGGTLAMQTDKQPPSRLDLKRTARRSQTEGLAPPVGAIVLLPFQPGQKPSTEAWMNPSWMPLEEGSMEVGQGDIVTKANFGAYHLHLEFMIPYEPAGTGQGRGNSGVYLADKYEIQVLDSFGLQPGVGDCAAVYSIAAPKVNACLPPLTWQTYDIEFRPAQKGPDGAILKRPRTTVRFNGIIVHQEQEIPRPTAGGKETDHPSVGPIRIQDHGHKVRYRNIWLVPINE